MKRIRFETFLTKYIPVKNHLKSNAPISGYMFETFGEELDYVWEQPVNNVWTIIEGTSGAWYITTGKHLINRIGYLVTENQWTEEIEFKYF
ncbi:MAG: hypothetical protein WAT71_12330 [Ignavibacteria bacterium]